MKNGGLTLDAIVETTPESEATFQIHLLWSEIDKETERVYKTLAQKYKVPGFRPGHAPRAMIERMVGKDAMYSEAIETLADKIVRQTAAKQELMLLEAPHVHMHEIHYGEDHDLTVVLPVLKKGELSDYTDISIPINTEKVTDEEIETVIDRVREQNALYVPVERAAALSDRVTVNMTFTVGEKEISNLKDHEFTLVDDRVGMFAGMDEHIIGMLEGEQKAFTTTIPEEYGNSNLAGKEAQYDVTLTNVSVKELPEVNDEFAKTNGKVETIAELRESIRMELMYNRIYTAQRESIERLSDALVERLTLAIPAILIEAELDDMVENLTGNLKRQNIDLDQYLELLGKDMASYRTEVRGEAIRNIKRERALLLVAEREGVSVSNQDLQQVLSRINAEGGKQHHLSQLSATQRSSLVQSLLRDKALNLLADRYVIVPSIAEAEPVAEETAEAEPVAEETAEAEPVAEETAEAEPVAEESAEAVPESVVQSTAEESE